MKTDIEIAQETKLKPVMDIAGQLGIPEDYVNLYGKYQAKISLNFADQLKSKPEGKLVLVTAITPTAYGEGKTTVSIGLSMALNKLGKKSIVCLREPSLGPVFGIKGGAAGGGYVQVLPMEDINLHFTGDFHAVSAAHNLLSAALDNHIHFGNASGLDTREILWRRTMDMNDRALRKVVVGMGGKSNGPTREDGFVITSASEVMAILGLSLNIKDLKERVGNILLGFTRDGKPVHARELGVAGSMGALLRDAINPNLVQTTSNTPAFVHTGPFANIAHGTNSIVATRMALRLSDYVITESGFGSDLGAEKFVDIVSRFAGYNVGACVVVTTIRAMKLHGGAPEKDLKAGTIEHLKKGLANLEKHIENIKIWKIPCIVAMNVFDGDSADEIKIVKDFCASQHVRCAEVRAFSQGADGAVELANMTLETLAKEKSETKPVYELEDPPKIKIEKVAKNIYGADGAIFTGKAEKDIERIVKAGFDKMPICIAKTNRSLSDDAKVYGRPRGYKITITDVNISSGAGFLVPLAGDVMLMPGLSKVPNAVRIEVDEHGKIMNLS